MSGYAIQHRRVTDDIRVRCCSSGACSSAAAIRVIYRPGLHAVQSLFYDEFPATLDCDASHTEAILRLHHQSWCSKGRTWENDVPPNIFEGERRSHKPEWCQGERWSSNININNNNNNNNPRWLLYRCYAHQMYFKSGLHSDSYRQYTWGLACAGRPPTRPDDTYLAHMSTGPVRL